MAQVIETLQRPALVLAPTIPSPSSTAQDFFPDDAVEFLRLPVRYPARSLCPALGYVYIEKEGSVNEAINRMRRSTRSLLERDDVIVVGLGTVVGVGCVETYSAMTFALREGPER